MCTQISSIGKSMWWYCKNVRYDQPAVPYLEYNIGDAHQKNPSRCCRALSGKSKEKLDLINVAQTPIPDNLYKLVEKSLPQNGFFICEWKAPVDLYPQYLQVINWCQSLSINQIR